VNKTFNLQEVHVPYQRNARGFAANASALLVVIALIPGLAACSTASSTSPSAGSPSAPPTEVSPQGDVPDNQAYVTFNPSTGSFALKVPEGWARTTSGAVTTFTDKLNSVAVLQTAAASAPTIASAKQIQVPALMASEAKFTLTDVKTFSRPGGSGVVITYLKDSPTNTVTGSVVRDAVEMFLFWKNGQLASVALTSPQGADNVDPWNIVTKSFAWLK
jgi:hypothetical protein